ncbi:MAG: 16S rRNA (guanine(527)-N(7))-methyltransferase RsmG [Clostridia bacterium]|nr:16S rRNA (guanine(527)-N(7))-methyltransferase RsmG [Clostridia bacterium]
MNSILQDAFNCFHLDLTEDICDKFDKYADLLIETNKKFNLTAITERDEVYEKHFGDSVSCAQFIDQGSRVIDVGCGAGFPGLPLKIAREDLSVTLLDSLAKRVNFLSEVCSELKLKDVTPVHMRAEDAGADEKFREKYDVSVARAVANLAVLAEYCLPFVKVGGVFLALKGRDADSELSDAEKAIEVLGGKCEKTEEVFWRGMEHRVIIIRKVCKTPSKYPRKAGKPSKSPII